MTASNPAPTPLAAKAMAAAREQLCAQLKIHFDAAIVCGELADTDVAYIVDLAVNVAETEMQFLHAAFQKHFQPLLAKAEAERDTAMEILDTVARGFERSLGRLLVEDKAGAERELKLAIAHVDNPHGYTGKSMAALRADLAAAQNQRDTAITNVIKHDEVIASIREEMKGLRADLAAKEAALDKMRAALINLHCALQSTAHMDPNDSRIPVITGQVVKDLLRLSALASRADNAKEVERLIETAPPALPSDLAALEKLGKPFAHGFTEKQTIENMNRAHAKMKPSSRADKGGAR